MKRLLTSALFTIFAAPALAQIEVHNAYVVANPGMPSAAALMHLMNMGDTDDRLIEARSDAAARVELHTHIDENGVMKMRKVEDGFAIPAAGHHLLERGADHIMMMGLSAPLADGDIVTFTLVFENAGELVVEVEVDNDFMPMMHEEGNDMNHDAIHGEGHNMDHSSMSGGS